MRIPRSSCITISEKQWDPTSPVPIKVQEDWLILGLSSDLYKQTLAYVCVPLSSPNTEKESERVREIKGMEGREREREREIAHLSFRAKIIAPYMHRHSYSVTHTWCKIIFLSSHEPRNFLSLAYLHLILDEALWDESHRIVVIVVSFVYKFMPCYVSSLLPGRLGSFEVRNLLLISIFCC